MKVKIIGAGSIGNHLAQACRRANWEVTIVDRDAAALERTKTDIYPKRYGAWDESIQLFQAGQEPKGGYDVILIGTPPDTHLTVARQALKEDEPRILQIEKPLCSPTLEGLNEFLEEVKKHPKTMVVVGYNHVLAQNTLQTDALIERGKKEFGGALTIDTEFRSHWSGVFKAHPWLTGPADTYLGFWKRGGGAGGEHSHAINLWQHFAHAAGAGRVKKVSAVFDYVTDGASSYDRLAFLTLTTEKGLTGRVVQDVISNPKTKIGHIRFEKARVEWYCDVTKSLDQVMLTGLGEGKDLSQDIQKTRPDEFFQEIKHMQDLLDGKINFSDSPIRLERAVETICVLAAAHRSYAEGKSITIEYPSYMSSPELFSPNNHSQFEIAFRPAEAEIRQHLATALKERYPFDSINVDSIGQVNEAEQASNNFKIDVVTETGTPRTILVRKNISVSQEKEVELFEKTLDFLRSKGVPVSPLIVARDGLRHVRFDEHVWQVFEFISGSHYSGKPEELISAAEKFAQLHVAFIDFPYVSAVRERAGKRPPFSGEALERVLGAAKRNENEIDALLLNHASFLRDMSAARDRFPSPSARMQVVHGDLHPHNTIFSDGKLKAILDFDMMRETELLRDVGFAAHRFARQYAVHEHGGAEAAVSGFEQFLAVYRKINPLSDEELKSLPRFLFDELLRRIVTDFSRYYFQGITRFANSTELEKKIVLLREAEYLSQHLS